jgi:hypothetical protein
MGIVRLEVAEAMDALPVFGEGWGGLREQSEPEKEPRPALPEELEG